MHLAFIGSQLEWQQLKPWLEAPCQHRVLTVLADPASQAWSDWPRHVLRADDFEAVLSDPQFDALVLGGSVPGRAERLRRTAQAGRACLCFLPVDFSVAAYHEAAMIAADTRSALVPMLTGRVHPTWQQLLALCRSGSLGSLRTVTIERTASGQTGRERLAGKYAEAADLLRSLVGEITEVTATGELAEGRLVVQHRTAAGSAGEIRLLTTRDGSDGWTLTLEAQRGRAELTCDAGLLGPATLKWSDSNGSHEATAVPGSDHSLLHALARARAGEPHAPAWQDAVRAAEIAESALLSLERRRAVDVYHQPGDELASFKGRMTTWGCGLIWLTLAMLVLIAAGKGLGLPGMDYLALGLAAVWLVFLSAQALRWVFGHQEP